MSVFGIAQCGMEYQAWEQELAMGWEYSRHNITRLFHYHHSLEMAPYNLPIH